LNGVLRGSISNSLTALADTLVDALNALNDAGYAYSGPVAILKGRALQSAIEITLNAGLQRDLNEGPKRRAPDFPSHFGSIGQPNLQENAMRHDGLIAPSGLDEEAQRDTKGHTKHEADCNNQKHGDSPFTSRAPLVLRGMLQQTTGRHPASKGWSAATTQTIFNPRVVKTPNPAYNC
jgi:hypothetical protein